VGGFPFVAVWDTRCPAEGALRTIELDSGARGVLALAFSPDGDTLAMVCADNQHTVYVWDWKKGKLLAEAKGATGEPPQVHTHTHTHTHTHLLIPLARFAENRTGAALERRVDELNNARRRVVGGLEGGGPD